MSKPLHEQYLRGGLGNGVVFKIDGQVDGGVAGVRFFDTRGARLELTADEFKEAARRFEEVSYQESPFESFAGAANIAMALEAQFQHYDGTRLVTILSVTRHIETGYYCIQVEIEGEKAARTLWRNRDLTAIRDLLNELRYRPPRTEKRADDH